MTQLHLSFVLAGTLLVTSPVFGQSAASTSKVSGFQVKNLVIPLPETDLYLQSYAGRSMAQIIGFHENGKDFMVAYNQQMHSLDVFNLTDKVATKQIKLQKEGPDGVQSIMGITYYKGQFVLNTMKTLKRVNKEGKVTLTREYPSFDSLRADRYQDWKLPGNQMNFLNYFYMDSETGTAAALFYPSGINESAVTRPCVILLYNLESSEETRIEIPYPKEFASKKEWGVLNSMQLAFGKDMLFITFVGSTTVHTYNLKTKAYNQYPVNTTLSPTLIKLEDGKNGAQVDEENEYSLLAGYYCPLQYDSFRNVFWRLYVGPVAPGKRTFDFNRKYCLTVLSADMKLIKQIPFPDNLSIYPPPIVGKERLWMNYSTAEAEEELWLLEVPSNVL